MKKEVYPKTIFHDQNFEDQTRKEIEETLPYIQKLLDCWNNLKLIPVHNLFELIYDPQGVHGRAVNQVVEVPTTGGQFQLAKDVYINMLSIPVPNDLYLLAKQARKMVWTGHQELWSVVDDGRTVIINWDLVDQIVNSHDIIVQNERAEVFASDVVKFCELSVSLNEALLKIPSTPFPPFTQIGKNFSFLPILQIEPELLREILQKL